MQPRRKQTPISIRSDRAAARLALLTQDGRSQAAVIEEALERLPVPPDTTEIEQRKARIRAILATVDPSEIPTMEEFDARSYDERGLPR